MNMNFNVSPKSEGSFHVSIDENKIVTCDSSSTVFEPQSSLEKRDSSTTSSTSRAISSVPAPEKQLTLFALRLAVLEKAATGLGTLGFIWATVVLLGGYAIVLDKTDFWFVTIILLIEGARIFSRSRELEWQHQATWSITESRTKENNRNEDIQNWVRKRIPTRTWENSNVPILPQWVFLSRNVSRLLFWLQLSSATACVVLSLMKLIKHNYGVVEEGDTDKLNRKAALNIFYALALSEALLFLLEKVYWQWKVIFCKLLENVREDCHLGEDGMASIRRFFYDAYSRCLNGSIFDGLKMDMVSFSMELVGSDSSDEQLIGVRILRQFAISSNPHVSDDTLQKIGISLPVMEKLVEMLNWKDPREEEIRRSAAEILSKLAGKKQNSLRVAGISGAMESIASLLYTDRRIRGSADEVFDEKPETDKRNYYLVELNKLGLKLLKKLAHNHDNCGKIGNTRGLLPKIIDFTQVEDRKLNDNRILESQIRNVNRTLQLVKLLVSTTGGTGQQLRKNISEIAFTISNMRDILRYGEKYPELQKLSIEILNSLGFEDDATERIGGTGGVLKELVKIFFRVGMPEDRNRVRCVAGEALAMLALDSPRNCQRILKMEVMGMLVQALEDRQLRLNAARILRNLCAYAGEDCFLQLREVTAAAPLVLKAITLEKEKMQEVMVGLATHILLFMTSEESCIMFKRTGITETDLATALVQILTKYEYPPTKCPRIRRFAIEMAIWMMRNNETNASIFRGLGMKRELEGVLETTSEIENFNIFSGKVGLSRLDTTVNSLVETALELLEHK